MDLIDQLRERITDGNFRLSLHAQVELVEDGFTLEDLISGIMTGTILEDYPDAQRGSCCLINGIAKDKRPIHIVVTTGEDRVIVITVYEPKPPKWVSSTERRIRE